MNKRYTVRDMAFVEIRQTRVTIGTQLNNPRARVEVFDCRSVVSAERLYASVAGLLEVLENALNNK